MRNVAGLLISVACCAACGASDGGRQDAGGAAGSAGAAAGVGAGMGGNVAVAGSSGAADGGGLGNETSDGQVADGALGETLDAAATTDAGDLPEIALPPENAGLDYQLGGGYAPAAGVGIVSRDRKDAIVPGLYNLCYVNGFQVQPDEESFWLDEHPDLILRDDAQQPVIDEDWDEMLIDVGTAQKRTAIAAIVGEWIAGCAAAGFDAVEIDNLDSFSRSGGRLDEDAAVAMMALFAESAHAAGLAIAQKNSAELVARKAELHTDFVVAEECNRWDECDVYTAAYGNAVLVIEYRRADFDEGCAAYPELSIVLRDLNLTTPASGSYVYDGC